MKLLPTKILGCYEVFAPVHKDSRGTFTKTFNTTTFKEAGLCTSFKEQYYSRSKRHVIRGLHFQLPPDDHTKLVYCTAGEVLDVVLDLRIGSPTYCKLFPTTLNAETGNMMYIPPGVAHGFCTPHQPATLVYNQTTVYNQKNDTGIHWNSAGISWPIKNPQLSERDLSFLSLDDFISPFIFEKPLI